VGINLNFTSRGAILNVFVAEVELGELVSNAVDGWLAFILLLVRVLEGADAVVAQLHGKHNSLVEVLLWIVGRVDVF
jgi:hypothetical protein